MSIKLYDKSGGTPQEVLLAGTHATDLILNGTSKNPIANKTVYNALATKIESTVENLVNFYNKSQVYNKQEVRDLIGAINTLTIEVVNELPTQDISATTIYFLKQSGANTYDEYIYVDNAWVKIGDTDIDLSGYLTTANFQIAIADYYTKSAIDAMIANYYTKTQVDAMVDAKQDELTFDNAPTAGSDNPVKSGGIKTALDAKQNTLTFDSTPTASSSNPVTSDGIKDAIDDTAADIYEVMGKNGAKNLYDNTMVSNTVSGVTFTKNSDGSVTVNGTATETIDFQMNLNVSLKKGEYILSGSPSGGGYATNYCLWLHNANHDVVEGGEGQSFSVASDESGIVMSIVVYQGTTVNSLVFKPMIRLASDTDDTYVPYAMTNSELTERKIVSLSTTDFPKLYRTAYLYMRNGVVQLELNGFVDLSQGENTAVITLPQEFRPDSIRRMVATAPGTSEHYRLSLYPNGRVDVYCYSTSSSSANIAFDMIYIK